jgi:hypothetical protein
LRGGELFFQAANPKYSKHEEVSHYKTLHDFSESVLQHHPVSGSVDESGVGSLRSTVEAIAMPLQITVEELPPSN